MIDWRPLLDAKNKPLPDYYEGWVGRAKVAIVKLADNVIGKTLLTWQGHFFPDRAHYFRDTLEEAKRTAEEYWENFHTRTKVETAEERMWH